MYSTCIFCQKPLGDNEIIEHFPIGRRLAFDSAKGRLWVVCRHCERWNLSPLETRWEGIEECERAFHGTRLRVSTDNIGMARLSEGLELVRIGEPLRPEFAAWRYGDQFGRRRRRAVLVIGGVVVAVGAVVAGAAAIGASVGSFGGLWGNIPNIINGMRRVKVKTDDGRVLTVRGTTFNAAQLSADPDSGTPVLKFKQNKKDEIFEGEEAVRVATTFLPAVNFAGASKQSVKAAVERLETFNGSEGYLEALWAGRADSLTKTTRKGVVKPQRLQSLASATRITLEMALHEEQERRAIRGELHVLEAAWREAEEIANIADNMFVPDETVAQLEEMRRQVERSSD
jgi:hypothetical protein